MHPYQLTRIRQHFPDKALKDVRGEVRKQLIRLTEKIPDGGRIAVGVGSRGICNLQTIVREAVDWLKEQGTHPFIIPAMGSHGGATAEGQLQILASYGITESNMGSPVRSSMETVTIAGKHIPNPIYMDKMAYEADGVILINKVKPHTDFHATYESGLVKMAVIGLGKEKGAASIHHHGVYGLTDLIPATARIIFRTGKILGGLALLEDANDHTMMIRAIRGEEIMDTEPELLDIARATQPAFPVDDIDVLLIDRMGKNISGAGIDTNIIGRTRIYGQKEPDKPAIRSVAVTDLTDESHGNAIGIGLADVITRKLFDKIDFATTYKNVVTSSFLERGKIPVVAENDREALSIALRNSGVVETGTERIIRIQDTLHLGEMLVSDSVWDDIRDDPRIERTGESIHLFDDKHQLIPF